MDPLLTIIIVVFGILQLVLFFKVWGMTDDIRAIKNKYVDSQSTSSKTHLTVTNATFSEGDTVRHLRDSKDLVIRRYDSSINKYICYSTDGVFEGSFAETELNKI